MANSERGAAKELQWREIVGRQAASGLSVRAFCRQAGIGEPSFYFWRRTLRARDAGPPPVAACAFVPAVVHEHAAPLREASILFECGAGLRLCLPVTISATWVAELLRALPRGGER
jgi:transposase-like protein